MFISPKSAYIDIYNKYYGLKQTTDKGINNYQNSWKKIARYLKYPVSTCKFCTYGRMSIDWEPSERNMNDWNAIEDIRLMPNFQAFRLKK